MIRERSCSCSSAAVLLPFHIAQEPPLGEVLDHSNDEEELVPTDERQSEVTGSVHHVWVVQISFPRCQHTPGAVLQRIPLTDIFPCIRDWLENLR